jgi:hypothetical protein
MLTYNELIDLRDKLANGEIGLELAKAQCFLINQCVYPTVKGVYPWQDEWPKGIRDLQPILGAI